MLNFRKMFGIRNRSARRNRSLFAPVAERLEIRTVPTTFSGTVSVSLVGTNLRLTGDSSNNGVEVHVNGSSVDITGLGSTKFKLSGQAAVSHLNLPIPSGKTAGNITVSLGSGDDVLEVYSSAAVTVSGNVTVNLGTGNDIAAVSVGGEASSISVKGKLSIDGGDGNDIIVLTSTTETVTRDDLDAILTEPAPEIASHIEVGSLAIKGGVGVDFIGLIGVDVAKNATVDSGTAANKVDDDRIFAISSAVGGNLSVTTGNSIDIVAIDGVEVGGKTSIDTGAGWDTVIVNNASFGSNVSVNLGKGNDSLIAGNNVDADPTKVSLDGGSDTDYLTVNLAAVVINGGGKVKSFVGVATAAAIPAPTDLTTILDHLWGEDAEGHQAGLGLGIKGVQELFID